MTALYIHIPFCARKCDYCDFVSFAGRENDFEGYIRALEREFASARARYGRLAVDTVFIGGGTPSLLPSDAVMRLLAMARARFDVAQQAEITLEANPGTLTPDKLRDYRDAGVNRLSIGMQAAQAPLLSTLGRIHTMDQVTQSVSWARSAGFKNINLDLMYALPGQRMADWVETIRAALSLKIEHISCYSLIVEPGTPIARRLESGELNLPGEEAALAMQHAAARILKRHGYARYEISNYALSGFECRHNMAYWTRKPYLGLGCAAHSLMNEERFSNTESLDDYLSGVCETRREKLTPEDIREETIMLRTRTSRGVPLEALAGKKADRLIELGLAQLCGGRLCLTERGMDVHNAVVLELI